MSVLRRAEPGQSTQHTGKVSLPIQMRLECLGPLWLELQGEEKHPHFLWIWSAPESSWADHMTQLWRMAPITALAMDFFTQGPASQMAPYSLYSALVYRALVKNVHDVRIGCHLGNRQALHPGPAAVARNVGSDSPHQKSSPYICTRAGNAFRMNKGSGGWTI